MNKIRDLLRKIMALLDSSDLTNTEERKKLAEEYSEACKEYESAVSECQTLLERKMVTEATTLAEKKDLLKVGAALRFSERPLLLDMCKMYGWPIPEEIRLDVIEELFKTAAGGVDVARLIAQYRQVMRSDNVQEKVFLLRKICKLDPKPEWKDTLVAAEKLWLKNLMDKAKEAILQENPEQVQFYSELLGSSSWTVQVPDVVLKKLRGLVEKYHQDDLAQRAENLCSQIGVALSLFDFDAMQYGLNKWDAFVQTEGYDVPEHLAEQISNAKTWFTEEAARREKQQQAERLIAGLQAALENSDSTLEELDGFVQKLQMMEWEIPQGTLSSYNSIRAQILVARERRRRIIITAVSVASLLIVSIGAWFIYTAVMDRNEKLWVSRIEKSLKNKEPETGLKLLDELAKKSPSIRKRGPILELEDKLNKMKTEHDSQRKLFAEQLALCREKLPEYTKNKGVIDETAAKMKALILDPGMKQEYEKLVSDIEVARNEAAQDLRREYERDVEKIEDLRKDFFIALDEENLEKARQCIAESEKLRTKLLGMKDVAKDVQDMHRKTLESVSEMEPLLVKSTERINTLKGLRRTLNAPESFDAFIQALKVLSRDFSDKPEMKTWQNFIDVFLPYAEKIDSGDNQVLSQLRLTAAKVKRQEDSCKKILDKLKADFTRMVKDYKDEPIYCILAEDSQNKDILHGFYYNSTGKLKPKSGETLRFYALSNEVVPGKVSQYVAAIYFPDNSPVLKAGTRFQYSIRKDNAVHSVNVTLVYPKEVPRSAPLPQALAPHVLLTRKLAKELEDATPQELEAVLIRCIRSIFAEDKTLHPFSRLTMVHRLAQSLSKISGDEMAAKLFQDIDNNFKEPGFDNWERKWMLNTEEMLDNYSRANSWVSLAKATADQLKVSSRHLSRDFAKGFLGQRFSGVGYLIQRDGGWRFIHVNKDLANKELYILSPDSSKFEFLGIYPECARNIQVARENRIIPVFALMSGSLRSLEEIYLAQAKQDGVKLEYPAGWPIKSGDGK